MEFGRFNVFATIGVMPNDHPRRKLKLRWTETTLLSYGGQTRFDLFDGDLAILVCVENC